jgi:beta-glucosidase
MDAETEGADAGAVEGALGALDLERRVRLLTGSDYWTTAADERVGLRAMALVDGPAGVRGQEWDERFPSVSLPSPTACAATWDESLVARLAGVLAAEARRKGVDAVLGPVVNLQRSPLAGRHFEYLSEDPLLSGRIGVAYVRGLQAHGVAATAKHYVCNDSETNRFSVDVRVDERALREVYLAPFEALVEGGVWVVMAAYNRVNGVTMTESPLLRSPLLTEWGFDGVVVSDWYAARSTEASALAGLGLVMPGPRGPWGDALIAAVRDGGVPPASVEDKARRLLRLAARVGALAGVAPAPPVAEPASSEVSALLREAAAAAMVLVRNQGVLPLDPTSMGSLAVLGPNAAKGVSQGGGTAEVVAADEVAPLDGLRSALVEGVEVLHAAGARTRHGLGLMPGTLVTCPHCGEAGLRARYLDAAGRELRAEHRAGGLFIWYGSQILRGATVEVSARFRADATGTWQIGLTGVGAFDLRLDGASVISETIRPGADSFYHNFLRPPQRAVTLSLVEGQELDLVLSYRLVPAQDLAKMTLGVLRPGRSDDEELADAVQLAARADTAVVVVGTTEEIESEGLDRVSLELPGRQDELVRAVAAVNPRTIVVVNTAGPVAMPWRDEVAAVLVTWLPGQEFGHALADVLLGAVEPGGRLPMTWGTRGEDVPVLSTTPTGDVLPYTEGVHVGYRAWLRSGAVPAYPFGHGLGYTAWAYEGIEAPGSLRAGDGVTVRVQVRNTGPCRGKEVVQAYLSRPVSGIERPARWLAGFGVVEAGPGQATTAEIRIEARAFQHWSVDDQAWRTEPGTFLLSAGRSVSDLALARDIEVEP